MTVKELQIRLQAYPDTAEIVLAKDEEGNQFSPVIGVELAMYTPCSDTTVDVYPFDMEQAALPNPKIAIVLWPKC